MIRLIALDLDQTIFGNDLVVSPRVKECIRRAQAAGVLISIATGREPRLAAMFARELSITAPIICSQGGCIYDPVHGEVLHEVRLSPELLPRILSAARRCHWNIHFELPDRLYFPSESNHPPGFFELLRYSHWVRVGDLLKDMPEPPYKFIVTLNQLEDRTRTIDEIRASLSPEITVVPSHPHLIEGVPAGVHKGHGLAWLAKHLRIQQQEVMAVGDSEADLPMIEWAGIGVAMGNGSEVVKAAADWVAPTLQEHGAALAIERFALTRDLANQ